MRQESIPLDYEKRSGRAYEVLEGIKSLSFKYTSKTIKIIDLKEEKKEDKAVQQKLDPQTPTQEPSQKIQKTKTEILYTSGLTMWNSDEKQESESKREESKAKILPIPVFIEIEAVLWDSVLQREFSYLFSLEIITDTQFAEKKKPWSFKSFFEKQHEPQSPIMDVPQKAVSNTPYQPTSNLQKQLEELFKTAHSLDKRTTA
jgi:hypothetical protein